MHQLHTTQAFVVRSMPHGESNRVYVLLSRELGLIYAHAQGVRELRNRNRFALRSGSVSLVTLVRGREVWRITSVRCGTDSDTASASPHEQRVLALLERIMPQGDPATMLFDILYHARLALREHAPAHHTAVEALALLKLLNELGYVGRPVREPIITRLLGLTFDQREDVAFAQTHQEQLLAAVNNALREATA